MFDIARSIRIKQFNASYSVIADELKKQFSRRESGLYPAYDEFLKSKSTKVTKPTIRKYKRTKSLLNEYEKLNREKLTFDKFTPLFFEKFFQFLITEKQHLNNTAHKTIQFLKSFLIWANTNGFTDNESYKTFKSKSETTEVIFLTETELMKLYNLQLESERLERVRDLFCFQCFTGVRYSDIQNLKREDLDGATWNLRTQKTKDIIQIPLSSYAVSMLAKYSDWEKPLPAISNQKANKFLKELCEIAGIDTQVKTIHYRGIERIEKISRKFEVVGTHTARRTFISLSLQKGMKPDVIMAITGHKTYKMMQKYLKIADDFKRTEMDRIWGSPIREDKNS